MVGLPEKQIVSHSKPLILVSILWLHSFSALLFLPQGRWEACQSCRGTLTVKCYFSQLCRHQDYWTWHKLIIFLQGKRDARQKKEPWSARASLSWSTKEQAVQCTATAWRCQKWCAENTSLQPALSLSSASTGQGTHRVRKECRGLRRGWWVGGSKREQWSMPQSTFSPYLQSETQQHLQSRYCCSSSWCCFPVCSHFAFEAVHQALQHRRFAFFTRFKHYLEARRRDSWGIN